MNDTYKKVKIKNLEILFENDDILAVNKPSGLCTIPSKLHFDDNLANEVKAYLNDQNFVFRPLNRLDRLTYGIVLIAKLQAVCSKFKFLNKEYFAICNGTFDAPHFVIDSPIKTLKENGKNVMKRVISPDGKPSHTEVDILKSNGKISLVKLTLKTGRTHQIRVHLSSIGNHIIGDELYFTPDEKPMRLMLKKVEFALNDKTFSLEIPFPDFWELKI